VKYVDFTSLLEGSPAHIAFLSTFQFDPDFFERRLLRCPALAKARRIVVFLDARQWFDLLRRDVPARWLNRRYLVVPVQRVQGAFHPKLSLLLTEAGGRVLCGSNNLTRSGCSNNLELLNAVPFDFEAEALDERDVAREAFAFFEQAAGNADVEITRIAMDWIGETAKTFPWLREPVRTSKRRVRLLHTYDGNLWDRIVQHIGDDQPKEFFIASPFHDADGVACLRLASKWPNANIEFLIQQEYTNLAVKPLKKLQQLHLSELRDSSRRIHAKLLAWRTASGFGCLVGSANFTSAALDGRNIETCLLISEADELIESLFDKSLSKHPLALAEFVPGEAEPPEAEGTLPPLRIDSAVLRDANQLRVSYSHQFDPLPDSLRLTIRIPGEVRPRASISIHNGSKAAQTVQLPDSVLADSHGTLLASLVAEIEGVKVESLAVWVIQETRLTHEPGEGSASSKRRIEDTGEGLAEFLDELGRRDGLAAVVDYLRHLNIRFHGGSNGALGQRRFRLKMRDPFHPDDRPEWIDKPVDQADGLEKAIHEFVDRHEKRRLRRHASLGNINGMENFLDIFSALIRLLYVYYKRGVVKRGKLIGRLCTFIELATVGKESEKEQLDGYLRSVFGSLGGDRDLLQEACDDTNYLSEVRAALLIVQSVRFDPNEKPLGPGVVRPREVLPNLAKSITETIREFGLQEPRSKAVQQALDGYRMFTETEIAQLMAEMPSRAT
jgi:HKD family nuclease